MLLAVRGATHCTAVRGFTAMRGLTMRGFTMRGFAMSITTVRRLGQGDGSTER